MKTKTLLIAAISFITILFMSCQKDEMDQGIGAGDGGKEVVYRCLILKDTLTHKIDTKENDYFDSSEIDLTDSSVK